MLNAMSDMPASEQIEIEPDSVKTPESKVSKIALARDLMQSIKASFVGSEFNQAYQWTMYHYECGNCHIAIIRYKDGEVSIEPDLFLTAKLHFFIYDDKIDVQRRFLESFIAIANATEPGSTE